jgi:hypothetical protein
MTLGHPAKPPTKALLFLIDSPYSSCDSSFPGLPPAPRGYIQKHFLWQHRAPVSHEPVVFPVIERQVAQIVCVSVLAIKALEVNR